MTTLVKVRQRGQITLPKSFRSALGVVEDGQMKIEFKKGKLIMEPVITTSVPARRNRNQDIESLMDRDRLSPRLKAKIKEILGPRGFSSSLSKLVGAGSYVPLGKESEVIEAYLHKKYG